MTRHEIRNYLRTAIHALGSARIHFTDGKESRERHRRDELEALLVINSFEQVWASTDDFPQDCFICGGVIQNKDDREYHGMGNCVEICTRCGGSGEEPKA